MGNAAKQISPDDEAALWDRLRSLGDESARLQLIEAYQPLARTIAAKVYSARVDEDIEYNDYLQYAILGLIESTDRYDPAQAARFSTYASYRIRGSILSGIEKYSEKREQIAFRKRHLNDRMASLSQSTKKAKNSDSFAELVELTVGMALSFILEGTGQVEEKPKTDLDMVYENHAIEEIQGILMDYLDLLPEREQLIIRYHYYKQVGFDELASILGISKGRVSQLHKSAILELRRHYEKNSQFDSYY
ncbi:MAG: sigma-70 family RNA polymerase sigma factor [Candidatus Sedimenticola sp. (ex Thyasira tokunagai)]